MPTLPAHLAPRLLLGSQDARSARGGSVTRAVPMCVTWNKTSHDVRLSSLGDEQRPTSGVMIVHVCTEDECGDLMML